ncbi:MarR family winged helix-turn-helix transcriptional regulator [Paraglaciecola sp. 2405UD69-4]|uniref:MarR family winged helix-turn-helix transcriptional regulator n=1 Tax=Paraglaciecola sp. 2405UD69-4 TaxID=3391836 RepID=UPI0039C99F32
MTIKSSKHKFHLLLHSADLLQEYLSVKLLALGITSSQARVIKALNRLGKISQIDLAREFDITAASMSTMTSRLTALGFITTQKDPANAKRNLLSLTPKGTAIIDDIEIAWASVDEYIEELIGKEKQHTLAELTQELRDSLGGHKPGERPASKPNS